MTLKKSKYRKLNLLIIIVGLALLVVSLSNVFIYNKIVILQHRLKSNEKDLRELRVANVNLKNQLYKLLDIKNINQLSQKEGLIKVQKPQYLEVNLNNDTISFHHSNN